MPFYHRKLQRLRNYDYSQNNAYFITICTQNKKNILGRVLSGKIELSNFGVEVEKSILLINSTDKISVENYVIMPNHLHLLILISRAETVLGTTRGSFPTISEIIQRFKTATTKKYIDGVKTNIYSSFDHKVWQKSFHDHIIRNKNDYLKITEYINNNPIKWQYDCFYNEL